MAAGVQLSMANSAQSMPPLPSQCTQSQCCLAVLKAVCAQVSMANSSWTQTHIRKLWGSCPHLVYPPVDTASLQVQVLIHSLGL